MAKKLLLIVTLSFILICMFASCDLINSHTHSFGEWETVKTATCMESGINERYCECGEKQTQSIGALGHQYGEWVTTKEPKCTEIGSKERYCECGECQTQSIGALGHQYGEWVTTTNSTCTQDGKQERSCSCGEKETEIIVASHAWQDATCTEAKNCGKCGLTDGTALGHTCSVGTCTRCSATVYPTVKLPSTPMTIWYYDASSMEITELSYQFNSYGTLIIYFSGEKTSGGDSVYVGFRYKILDADGYVIDTGSWIELGYNTGDKFKTEGFRVSSSLLSESSEYTIIISDCN